jgi:hypothetical protein
MASVQSSTDEQSFLARFAELRWLDALISFIFRLLAKLAEPFLAFGLIASAIDYGSHGEFLGEHQDLMTIWMITQGLALEGSGGIALSMSFDAASEGDATKAWMQRGLALALLFVGGVMFFVELVASAKGFKESSMPDWYVLGMAGLRALVSLGYIAMCRTAHHRFSGSEVAQQPATPVLDIEAEVAQQVKAQIGDVCSGIQEQLDELRNAVEGSIAELPAQIKAAAQDLDYEVDPDALSAQVNEAVAHGLRTLDLSAQIRASVEQVVAMTVMRPLAQAQKTTDELAQPLGGKETMKIPSIGEETEKKQCVQRYVAEQRERGHEPTLEEIMAACRVAKNTASKYRKTVEA